MFADFRTLVWQQTAPYHRKRHSQISDEIRIADGVTVKIANIILDSRQHHDRQQTTSHSVDYTSRDKIHHYESQTTSLWISGDISKTLELGRHIQKKQTSSLIAGDIYHCTVGTVNSQTSCVAGAIAGVTCISQSGYVGVTSSHVLVAGYIFKSGMSEQ